MAFEIKSGDTIPILRLALTEIVANPSFNPGLPVSVTNPEEIEEPLDLTAIATVSLIVRVASDTARATDPFLRQTMTVELPKTNGIINYKFTEMDTRGKDGTYNGEVELLWSNGDIETAPRHGFFPIIINPDLDKKTA